MLALLKRVFQLNSDTRERVCIQIGHNGLSVVVVRIKPAFHILDCQCFSGDIKAQQDYLHSFVTHNQLQKANCY